MQKNTIIIPLEKLIDFEEQPFKVKDDSAMTELAESIKTVGVLVPIIVRKADGDMYEIISGHRRKRACELAGVDSIPATVHELNDDEAAILLVDCNLQREHLLPSERAYAYKLKYEALKRQGQRNDLTSGQFVRKLEEDKSGRQIRRYIRLTQLIYQLLDKVDEKRIPATAGAELSYLSVKWQAVINDEMDKEECNLSMKQAEKIRKCYADESISIDAIQDILSETEGPTKVTLDYSKLKKYFPEGYSAKQCEEALWKIIAEYYMEV